MNDCSLREKKLLLNWQQQKKGKERQDGTLVKKQGISAVKLGISPTRAN